MQISLNMTAMDVMIFCDFKIINNKRKSEPQLSQVVSNEYYLHD